MITKDHVLDEIRKAELEVVLQRLNLNNNLKVLELGSGSGYQLELLANVFKDVVGIDVDNQAFAPFRSDRIIVYDGINYPFEDNSFDLIFSSCTLEHIADIKKNDFESKRVLNKNGICVHILPTHHWRLWSIVVHYFILPLTILRRFNKFIKIKQKENTEKQFPANNLKNNKNRVLRELANFIFPEQHGERGNRFTEYFLFKPKAWLTLFKINDWEIIDYFALGIFYSGHSIPGIKLSLNFRKNLAKFIGSASYCYVIKKNSFEEIINEKLDIC
jgi:ubiquinone/menaquinone biosynthesis C-methylase UbiE